MHYKFSFVKYQLDQFLFLIQLTNMIDVKCVRYKYVQVVF